MVCLVVERDDGRRQFGMVVAMSRVGRWVVGTGEKVSLDHCKKNYIIITVHCRPSLCSQVEIVQRFQHCAADQPFTIILVLFFLFVKYVRPYRGDVVDH